MPDAAGPSEPYDPAALGVTQVHAQYAWSPDPTPLLWPTVTLALGIWLGDAGGGGDFGWALALGLALATLGVLAATLRLRRTRFALVLVTVLALLAGYLRHQSAATLPPDHIAHSLPGDVTLTRLTGQIITTPNYRPPEKRNPMTPITPQGRTRFVIELESIDIGPRPSPASGRLTVTVAGPPIDLILGERVQLTGWLAAISPPTNPGQRDWARWYALQRIHAGLSVKDAALVQRLGSAERPWQRFQSWLRGGTRGLLISPAVTGEISDVDRLIDVLVLGQRSAASRALNETFVKLGTAPFLAASGFHVGVLATITWWIGLRTLRRHRRATWLVVFVLVLFVLVAEPNPPVIRATLMGLLVCAAMLLGRGRSVLNSLAAAAMLLLLWEPLELFNAGFQLSFCVVLVLIAVVPHTYRLVPAALNLGRDLPEPQRKTDADTYREWFWRRARSVVIAAVLVSLVAWLWSWPLVALHFNRVAPLGWLNTLLVLPFVVVTIWAGFIAAVTGIVLAPLGISTASLVAWPTALLLWWVELLEGCTGWTVSVSSPPAILVFLHFALTLTPLWLWRAPPPWTRWGPVRLGPYPRRTIAAAFALTVLLWTAWFAKPTSSADESLRLWVLDVGSGSAMILLTPDGDAIVFDVGTLHNFDVGATVADALRSAGVERIPAIAISHANFDHYSGIGALFEQFEVDALWLSPHLAAALSDSPALSRLRERLPSDVRRRVVAAGDTQTFGALTLELLWPPADMNADEWNVNDRSQVWALSAYGRRILLTGDIEGPAMARLLDWSVTDVVDLSADVLLAPHHGSVIPENSPAFYAAVAPSDVVASTGLPRPKTQRLLEATFARPPTLRTTDELGAIGVEVWPSGRLAVERLMPTR